jgi:hypothetical protein
MIYQDAVVGLMSGDVPALDYDEESGVFAISPAKAGVKWAWQPGRLNNTFPAVLTPNQATDINVKTTPEDGNRGDTEVIAFLLTSTGRVAIQPYVPVLDKQLSNVPLSSSLMFGTSQLPALLAQTLYSYPSVDWTLAVRDLTGVANTISPVLFGRRFVDRKRAREDDLRQAQLISRFMHAYWIGPSTGFTGAGVLVPGGPEVALAPGGTVTLEYPVPGDAAFDCRWILDDSTSTTGLEPLLTAQIFEGDRGSPLNDVPMSWRDFLASPTTLAVAGAPSGGFFRAASLPSPGGCWSHLFERATKIRVTFVSTDAGTITLRTAFAGTAIYVSEPVATQVRSQAGNVQARMVS